MEKNDKSLDAMLHESQIKELLHKAQKEADNEQSLFSLNEAQAYIEQHFKKRIFPQKKEN